MSSRNVVSPLFSTKPLALAISTLVAGSAFSGVAAAQDEPRRASSALLEEVVVTARKREEGSQDVPLSITAFGSDQIEALKIRDLTNLAVGMPNVALDDIGTTRGTANFSIRGLGINSSIPSIDPTVGVFINGIYIGLNNGIIFDVFDLESIEVLRGPQGILFGRNVTGGAVLMNTKKPGEEFEATVRAAVDGGGDGGLNRYLMGSVGGPITDTLGVRFTAYLNDDEGYFENQFNGEDYGAVEQTMFRGTVQWAPTDRAELLVTYENTDIEGDGAVAQTHTNGLGVPGAAVNFDRDSLDVSNDEMGFQNNESDFLSVEFNYDVDFGDGTITALYGWRDSFGDARIDVDSQPVWIFHAPSWLGSEQNSIELRYNGQFGDANITTGVYWFENELEYHERREFLGLATGNVAPAQQLDGGGLYDVETMGVFAAMDYDLTDLLTLTVGARYTQEDKSAQIASLSQNISVIQTGFAGSCNIVLERDCTYDFVDDDSWNTFSPKVGLSYALSDEAQLYTHWTRGFRSGGYNLRNTSFNPADTPGPFDEEQVDNFEIGYKSQQSWGRLNASFFYNQVDNMQRELNLPGPVGVIQLVRNTADATLWGVEVDGTFRLSENLLLLASLGYIDASYDEMFEDLNNDGVIDGADKALDIPRAPELTYSIGLNYDITIGNWGYATARINYAYRDQVAFTDDNNGFILEQDILDAGLDFYSNSGNWVLSLYGRNMLDSVKHGGDTQLPPALGPVGLGGTFSPLARGQVYGAEVTYNF